MLYIVGSYEEAEKLMDKLQYEPYAYSTENEASAMKKSKEDEEFFKQQKSLPPANILLNSARKSLHDDSHVHSGKL